MSAGASVKHIFYVRYEPGVLDVSYDEEFVPEMVAGLRTHWDGLFQFGAPDGVVVMSPRMPSGYDTADSVAAVAACRLISSRYTYPTYIRFQSASSATR